MQKFWSRSLFYLSSMAACTIMALTSGCASGGFKLTRKFAGVINSQQIIIRIILYILTAIVFAVTLLIDLVVFNTMDFWEGRVSEGTYDFKDRNKTFHVRHEKLPDSKLKRSTIIVKDLNNTLLQEVVLSETLTGEIEMYVDGILRARGHDIHTLPTVSVFNSGGALVESKAFWMLNSANQILTQKSF